MDFNCIWKKYLYCVPNLILNLGSVKLFKINQTKVTNSHLLDEFCLADFKFSTKFKF